MTTMLSAHFSAREFACPCCGTTGKVSPELLAVLESARRLAQGRPLRIVSGTRCRRFNRRVGGKWFSQHLAGRAADVPAGYLDVAGWEAAGAHGIGVRRGRVVHVDVTPGRGSFVLDD